MVLCLGVGDLGGPDNVTAAERAIIRRGLSALPIGPHSPFERRPRHQAAAGLLLSRSDVFGGKLQQTAIIDPTVLPSFLPLSIAHLDRLDDPDPRYSSGIKVALPDLPRIRLPSRRPCRGCSDHGAGLNRAILPRIGVLPRIAKHHNDLRSDHDSNSRTHKQNDPDSDVMQIARAFMPIAPSGPSSHDPCRCAHTQKNGPGIDDRNNHEGHAPETQASCARHYIAAAAAAM